MPEQGTVGDPSSGTHRIRARSFILINVHREVGCDCDEGIDPQIQQGAGGKISYGVVEDRQGRETPYLVPRLRPLPKQNTEP